MNFNAFKYSFDSFNSFKIISNDVSKFLYRSTDNIQNLIITIGNNSHTLFEFSEFQITLLKIILFIFLTTLYLIWFFWKKYGPIINNRFISPSKSTIKEIELLRSSVAKLKLPKEHSPRI